MFRSVGLDNTYHRARSWRISTLNLPMALWLMGVFVREVPLELEEAARIDGASTPALLWRVVLPLVGRGSPRRHPRLRLQLERVRRCAEPDA